MKLSAVALAAAAAASVAAGCAAGPVVMRGSSKTSADDLFRCMARQVERAGYAVTDADRDNGFLRGVRSTSTTRMVLRSGRDSEDRIVVTFSPLGVDGRTDVRASGESLSWEADGRKVSGRPTAQVSGDVRQVLEACGMADAVPAAGAPLP